MDNPKNFDLELVYDEQITPLMDIIQTICKKYEMPMFATFMFGSDEDDYSLGNTMLFFESRPTPEKIKIISEISAL